ncbi:MAG TPA: anti-sigma factor [Actinomycetota bacterium]
MSLDHTTIEELLAVQTLGGLDGDDVEVLARERAAHGDCDECRRLEDGFAETAGRLGFSLDPEPVDAGMADRIIGTPIEAPPPNADPPSDDLSQRRERRAVRGWHVLVAVAAAFALIVVAAVTLRPGTTSIVDASPSQQIVRFEGDGTDSASLAMAYTPGRPGAVFWGRNMPDPGEGQVYEIWMIQDGTPVGGGCVSPRDGTIALAVDADIGTTEQMAVTVEDAACPAAPTTAPIMSAQLV